MGFLVDPAAVSRLKAKGLIAKSATDYPKLAYEFGILSEALEDAQAKGLTFNDFVTRLASRPMSLTIEERAAIKYVKRSLAGHIKGLGDQIEKKTGNVILKADARLRHRLTQAIKRDLISGIEQRKAVKEVAKSLRDTVGDFERDWLKVAHTELHNAYQEGKASAILVRHNKGYDPVVYKATHKDSCEYCKTLYVERDGVTPRLFYLSDLTKSGVTNIGRKAGDPHNTNWKPVLGSTHPFCMCDLRELPRGFEFGSRGELKRAG